MLDTFIELCFEDLIDWVGFSSDLSTFEDLALVRRPMNAWPLFSDSLLAYWRMLRIDCCSFFCWEIIVYSFFFMRDWSAACTLAYLRMSSYWFECTGCPWMCRFKDLSFSSFLMSMLSNLACYYPCVPLRAYLLTRRSKLEACSETISLAMAALLLLKRSR